MFMYILVDGSIFAALICFLSEMDMTTHFLWHFQACSYKSAYADNI